MWKALHDRRPRGNVLETADWWPVHRLLLWVLAAHVAGLAGLGIGLGHPPVTVLVALGAPAVCLCAGVRAPGRSAVAAVAVAVGLVCSSAALIGLSGLAAARFHVFVVVGLVALYQSWLPLLSAAVLALAGQALAPRPGLPTTADPQDPGAWLPAVLFGGAVLALAAVSALLWGIAERYRGERDEVGAQLTDVELGRRRFVSELLVNLARRSQGMVYRQLEILGRLQEAERDPGLRAELFRLDHLAVRVRRNAGNLLVLAGEQAPRSGGGPTSLREVVRAAVAETEDLDRVLFIVDEQRTVAGRAVADLTHLLAEVIENAVRFSPPDSVVTVRSRPDHGGLGRTVTVEDWGVGMPESARDEANRLLAAPPEIDLSVSQRLGLHVVARLAARHRITVALSPGADTGTVCSIALPDGLFEPVATPPADEPPPARPEGTAEGGGTTRLPLAVATEARTPTPSPPEPVGAASSRASGPPVAARTATAQMVPSAEAVTARVEPPTTRPPTEVTGPTLRTAVTASGPRLPAAVRTTSLDGQARPTPPQDRTEAAEPHLPSVGATTRTPTRVPAARPPATPTTGTPTIATPSGTPTRAPADGTAHRARPARAPSTDPTTARPAADTATTRIPATRPRPAPAETSTPGMRPHRPGQTPAEPSEVRAAHRSAQTSSPGPAPGPARGVAPPARRTEPLRLRNPEQPGPSPDRAGDVGRPSHSRPVDPPAPAAPEPAAAMPRRAPGRRAGGSAPLPGPFGSSGSWEGWWESPGESPSPVAATAPASTGPGPVVGGDSDRGPAPARRPRPPVAAPPGPARPAPATGPITWVEPADASHGTFRDAFRDTAPDTAADTARREDPPSGPALFDPDAELRTRVPQSNLAPELRAGPREPGTHEPTQHGRTMAAASALSRYQASREAARAAVLDAQDSPPKARSALSAPPIATDSTAERHAWARSSETATERGADDVPLDVAGGGPSTAPEHAPGPGRTSGAPAQHTAGPGTGATGAASDGTLTGENRAMDRDAPHPAHDTPPRADAPPAGDPTDSGR